MLKNITKLNACYLVLRSRAVGRVLLCLCLCAAVGTVERASAATGDLSQVTIVVGTPNKTGLERELIASGEDKGTPYAIKWAVFDSTLPLTEALRAGRVDIAAGGETGVLFAIAHGAQIAVLGATRYNGPSGSAILVRKDSPLQSVSDLRGAAIALPYYTAQHYQLAKALDKAGIPWDSRKILNLDTSNGLFSLLSGRVDAFVVWDPNVAIAQTEHGARVVAFLDRAVQPAGMLYANAADLRDPAKTAALKDLTRRILRARAWVNAHPDIWAAQMSSIAQVPLAAARLTVSRATARYLPADTPDVLAGWQQEIAYFHTIGLFGRTFDIKDNLAPGFDDIINAENAGPVTDRHE